MTDDVVTALRTIPDSRAPDPDTLAQLGAAVRDRVWEIEIEKLPSPQLTARELEVVRLVALGRSAPQIAAELLISERTANNHWTNVLTKLELRERMEGVIAQTRQRLPDRSGSPANAPAGGVDQTLAVGDEVVITAGPFVDFAATVTDIDPAEGVVTVDVVVFGRPMPVRLPFDLVRPAS